jgi:hypothetical protein
MTSGHQCSSAPAPRANTRRIAVAVIVPAGRQNGNCVARAGADTGQCEASRA